MNTEQKSENVCKYIFSYIFILKWTNLTCVCISVSLGSKIEWLASIYDFQGFYMCTVCGTCNILFDMYWYMLVQYLIISSINQFVTFLLNQHMGSLSDCNRTLTQNHLVYEWTLNHLAKFNHLTIWLNVWVFIHELSGCQFESCCSHLNFRYHACFEQGVPWHSGNCRVWIHFKTYVWHDKNIQA